jgi:uncharacterized membrane protein YraQ (UPF0718 family)
MNPLITILELFGGIILIFAIGILIGYLFKLDEYIKANAKAKKK